MYGHLRGLCGPSQESSTERLEPTWKNLGYMSARHVLNGTIAQAVLPLWCMVQSGGGISQNQPFLKSWMGMVVGRYNIQVIGIELH